MSRVLGPLAPRPCYCRRPRKTPHWGVFAGYSITRRKPSTFFFYRKKKVAKPLRAKSRLRRLRSETRLLRRRRARRGAWRPVRAGRRNAPSGKMRKGFRSLRGATRAPPWTCSPDGALPLRVLRTWAAPNMDYAQSFEKGGPKLYTLRYAAVYVGPAWRLNGA